jgi:hypothetical protein
MPKDCIPGSWIVERVEPNEDGTSAAVHLTQNTDYEGDQLWPEPGQELVVKASE